MADISGKGMPAALLSASARIIIREKIFQTESPADILDLVNRALYADLNKIEMFITIMLARLDTRTGQCIYSNAGHTRTMHWNNKARTIDLHGATSMPVGIFPDLNANEKFIQIQENDFVFLYSDGLTEAASPDGTLLGEEALAHFLSITLTHGSEGKPAKICDSIISYFDDFAEHSLLDDDRTLILIKRQTQIARRTVILDSKGFEELISLAQQESAQFGDTFSSELELVITELLTNIIKHAYGIDPEELDAYSKSDHNNFKPSVEIKFTAESKRLSIDVFDQGKTFDQASYSEPDLLKLQIGGYGYFLMQKLADTVTYTHEADNRNHWHIEKNAKEVE